MPAYIIAYDLNQEGSNYSAKNKALNEAIQGLSNTRARPLGAFWVIVTEVDSEAIRDELLPYLGDNDGLLVVKSGSESAWNAGISEANRKWLNAYL